MESDHRCPMFIDDVNTMPADPEKVKAAFEAILNMAMDNAALHAPRPMFFGVSRPYSDLKQAMDGKA